MVILPTVRHKTLMISIWRIWYWINSLFPDWVFFFILLTCLLGSELILWGEILSWSLMGVKGFRKKQGARFYHRKQMQSGTNSEVDINLEIKQRREKALCKILTKYLIGDKTTSYAQDTTKQNYQTEKWNNSAQYNRNKQSKREKQ